MTNLHLVITRFFKKSQIVAIFSCDSSSIPRFVTDGLTDGSTLGQSRAGQGRPHGNLTEPYAYLIGHHGAVIEPSWKVQTKPNHAKPNQILLKLA